MLDGHLNKCIECTKKDVTERYVHKAQNNEWLEGERKRGRDKYHRLNYRDVKIAASVKKVIISAYRKKYPEKQLARNRSQRLDRPFERANAHHWSYNKDHYADVIWLNYSDHAKAHRFIQYDPITFMYKRKDNGELLSNRTDHNTFINYCITCIES